MSFKLIGTKPNHENESGQIWDLGKFGPPAPPFPALVGNDRVYTGLGCLVSY